MSDRTRNIIVGLTTLSGLVGVIYMMVLFGYVPKWVEGGYVVTVELPDAGGIRPETRVFLKGIDVGHVRTVELRVPASRGVVATLLINDSVALPQGVRVVIDRNLLSGNANVGFDLSNARDETLATDGSAIVPGSVLSAAEQLFGGADAMAEPTKQLSRLAENFEKLSAEWIKVGANLKRLVEPRTADQVDQGEAQGNLATVLVRADERLAELKDVIAGMNKWLNDEKLHADVRATVANASKLTERYLAVADDLSGAITAMRETIGQARQGEGTIGKLINDPALYDNLNDAAGRVGLMLDELKLLLEKWKAEGVPIQY